MLESVALNGSNATEIVVNYQKYLAVGCGLLFLCILVGYAKADSLIVNGGFETGNLSGWTLSGNTSFVGVTTGGYAGVSSAHGGNYYAYLGPIGSDGFLMQQAAISTISGDPYTLQLWLASDGGTPNDFSVSFDGTTVLSLTDVPSQGWTAYTFNVVANTSSSNLTIGFRNDPGYLGLDDVSLTSTSNSTSSPVPLPKSVWTGAVLLLGGCGLRLKRQFANAAI
jgi:hypothetical protein